VVPHAWARVRVGLSLLSLDQFMSPLISYCSLIHLVPGCPLFKLGQIWMDGD
jgi:hypothetical protein